MKIGIIGQGAIGSLLAYYFKDLSPVLLVKNMETHAKSIVDLKGKQSLLDFTTMSVKAPFTGDSPPHIFDGLLISVKGYQLAQLISQIRPWLATDTRLIIIQNGMGGAQMLAEAFPHNLIYAGTTTDAIYATTKNNYQITAIGCLDLGPLWEMLDPSEYKPLENNANSWAQEKHWIDQFLDFHPLAVYHHNVSSALYTKLAINAVINPLTAVLQIKNGELFEYPEKVEMLKKEVFAVYAAIELEYFPDALSQAIDIVIQATSDNWSSMYQDVKHKRLTENQTMLGYLLKVAKTKNVNTPLMTNLYQQLAALDAAHS
ncbi:MAG: 2-dehydropantoate 2-reductase [Alphaproteobacteria bacterium]|jgi:2-dehydropantoate 2-reductase